MSDAVAEKVGAPDRELGLRITGSGHVKEYRIKALGGESAGKEAGEGEHEQTRGEGRQKRENGHDQRPQF
ncbi:hypothetical protein EVA_11855 [gut metagenome]|uniref:Uncharacterized protein n=1 Tax=gut metagenome TaxID=749906 RepID=J9GK80_9ZZZZ